MNEIKNRISNASNVLITSHKSPDGDAVGSSLALSKLLSKVGIKNTVVLPDEMPEFLKWMPDSKNVVYYQNNEESTAELVENADIIFLLDYNDFSRVGEEYGSLLSEAKAYKVMIDHHLNPTAEVDVCISDTNVCSTAQMIHEFISNLDWKHYIDKDIATCIYTGLVTDSGSFRFPSVDAKTHRIVADLMDAGLVHNEVHENLFDVNELHRLRLKGYALSEKLKVLPDVPVGVIYLTKEEQERFKADKGATEGLVNYALSVRGVQMAVLIKEDKDKVKMSFRSKGDIPVNEFSAAYFSGGGHKNAAGGVSFDTFENTINNFEKNVYTFFNNIK